MIDPGQFRQYVITPTLRSLGLGGLAAENLVLGTALVESGLRYLHQLGLGPAIGVYQCEPATHADIWTNYLNGNPLAAPVRSLMSGRPPLEQLATNLAYATAICRIHYRRVAAPLPAADDPAAMAAYHKRFYNTALGATDPAASVALFRQAIAT